MALIYKRILLFLYLLTNVTQVDSWETTHEGNQSSGLFTECPYDCGYTQQRNYLHSTSDGNALNFIMTEEVVIENGILDTITETYLSSCSITIFYEPSTTNFAILFRETLAKRPVKMYLLEESVLVEESTWLRSGCDGYFFLVNGGEALIQHASIDHFKKFPYNDSYFPPPLWNYKAYTVIILLGFNGPRPVNLIGLYNFKKTENLAILQGNGNTVKVWTHVLYTEAIGLEIIDAWSNGRFHKGNNIFLKKFDDFHGSKVRVATFELEPFVVFATTDDDNRTSRIGVDMRVIDGLSKAKNFTVDLVKVSNDEKWGKMYPDGSWDGLTGQVFHELSAIGVCNCLINGIRYELIDYSYPYNYMPLCFVAPSPKPLPSWKAPVLPFGWDTWVCIGIMLIAVGTILYPISTLSINKESIEFKSSSFNYLYVFGSLINRSANTMPAHMPTRVYTGFFWLFSLIISTAYSANLVAFLSVVEIEAPISTLKQLADSDLRIGANFIWKNAFEALPDKTILKLASKMELGLNYHTALEKVESREFAFIQNRQFLELNRDARFTQGGKSTIRIVEECFMNFNVGITLPRNSPLTDNLTRALLYIFESGMLSKWKSEVTNYVYRKHKGKRTGAVVESARVNPLNLGHLQGIFYILGIGYIIGILILTLENIFWSTKGSN